MKALSAQARAVEKTAAAARRYFDDPGEATAAMVLKARLDARRTRAAVDAELETHVGKRGDWLTVSAALADLADEAGWAVEEHARFRAGLTVVGRRLSEALAGAAAALTAAIESPKSPGQALTRAKNKALQIEDIRKTARRAAIEQPRLAAELAAMAVLNRFSTAAEAVHRAADALAARFAEAS